MKKTFICFIFLFSIFYINTVEPAKNKYDKTEDSSEKLEEATDKDTNEYEKKLDAIKYGLNSDIIKLIQSLQVENDTRFNEELQKIFSREKNVPLKNEVLKFFAFQKNDALKTEVSEILENFYDHSNDFIVACINYLIKLEIKDINVCESLHTIIDEEKNDLKETAILALGKLGESEDAIYLTEVYENDNNDGKLALIIRQAIMQALIDLHAPETFDFLQDIATDSFENSVIRARAITALGKIANYEAVDILINAFEDADPIIREATIAGLSGFSGNAEVEEILLQAFKDEYYKVRLQAIETAGETKNAKTIPFILYRAKTDPETVVKNKAIEILAKSTDSESQEWLKETFTDKKASSDLRIKIARELLQNNSNLIIEDVEKAILESLSDRQKKNFAYNLGKNISHIEDTGLVRVCEAFLLHKESKFKSLGLDIFKINKFSELVPEVERIASDKKSGALQKRAESLLGGKINSDVEVSETNKNKTPATSKSDNKTKK